jgi:hypothetical protein
MQTPAEIAAHFNARAAAGEQPRLEWEKTPEYHAMWNVAHSLVAVCVQHEETCGKWFACLLPTVPLDTREAAMLATEWALSELTRRIDKEPTA